MSIRFSLLLSRGKRYEIIWMPRNDRLRLNFSPALVMRVAVSTTPYRATPLPWLVRVLCNLEQTTNLKLSRVVVAMKAHRAEKADP